MDPRTPKTLRAGLYARVSTEDRGQDPETQLRPLREYAERRGFAVVGQGSRMSLADDKLEHVVVVPGGPLAPAA